MKFLFWFSLFMIFYAYLGYPLSLLLISVFKRDKMKCPNEQATPAVTLLISAYNEEIVIEEKIKNSLSLDYPEQLLEIVIVSDGSEDKTDEIAKRYTDHGVILRSYEGRIGKTACLNNAVPLAKGDIIVFSDANSQYDRNAIRELVKHFADNRVGFVSGVTRYRSAIPSEGQDSITLYTKLEILTKKLESLMGSCVGGDGAIFAIKRSLYQPLKDFDINDFVIPLNVVRQGYRGIIEEKAFCVERKADNMLKEFDRQSRITNRTIRAILNNRDMLNPFRFGFFSFELFSHKLLRFLVPFFLMTLFLSNFYLLRDGDLYLITFGGQFSIYLLAWLGHRHKFTQPLTRLVGLAHAFVAINAAVLWGWIKYFRGETDTVWVTSRQG